MTEPWHGIMAWAAAKIAEARWGDGGTLGCTCGAYFTQKAQREMLPDFLDVHADTKMGHLVWIMDNRKEGEKGEATRD